MKKRLLLTLVLLAAACTTASPPAESLTRTIVAVEEARLAAFRGDDKIVYSRLVADEVTMVHSNGEVAGKAEEMSFMRPSTPDRPLPTLHLEDTAVRGYGAAAVLTGSLVERREDKVVLRLRFTNVYARRGSDWVLVAGQLTRAAAG
ncbi:MAG TPA: nuclear transport factor 2 family protein [Allosphingosinicella sp.]